MPRTVADIMSTVLVRVNADDDLKVVRHKLQNGGIHHLPVFDDGEFVGLISDRDMWQALSPHLGSPSERERDLRTLRKRAHQIMSPRPYTIGSDVSLDAAASVLLKYKVSALPVVDDGQLVGLVSWRDLLRGWTGSPHDAA